MTKNNDGLKHWRFGRIYEREQAQLLNFFAGRDNILGPRFQLKREGEETSFTSTVRGV